MPANDEPPNAWESEDISTCTESLMSPPVHGVVTTLRSGKFGGGSLSRGDLSIREEDVGMRRREDYRAGMGSVWPVISLFVCLIAAALACSKYWDVLTDLFGEKVPFVLGSVVFAIVLYLYSSLKHELREKFDFLDRKNSDQLDIALWRLNLKVSDIRGNMDNGVDNRIGDAVHRVGIVEQTFELRTNEVNQKHHEMTRNFTEKLEDLQKLVKSNAEQSKKVQVHDAVESEKRILELKQEVNELEKKVLELERRAEKRISASERHFQEQLGEVGKLMIAMDRKYDAKLDSTMRKNFEHELTAVVDDLTGFWHCTQPK